MRRFLKPLFGRQPHRRDPTGGVAVVDAVPRHAAIVDRRAAGVGQRGTLADRAQRAVAKAGAGTDVDVAGGDDVAARGERRAAADEQRRAQECCQKLLHDKSPFANPLEILYSFTTVSSRFLRVQKL